MSFDSFPLDIKKYILYKLDFILACRCKIVCKQWNSILLNHNLTSYQMISPYLIFTIGDDCDEYFYVDSVSIGLTEYMTSLFPSLRESIVTVRDAKNLLCLDSHQRNVFRILLFEYTKKCISERTQLFHMIIGNKIMMDIETLYHHQSIIKFSSFQNLSEVDFENVISLVDTNGIIIISSNNKINFMFRLNSLNEDNEPGEYLNYNVSHNPNITYSMRTNAEPNSWNKCKEGWDGIGGNYDDDEDFSPGWTEGTYDEIIKQFKDNYIDNDVIHEFDLFTDDITDVSNANKLLSWNTHSYDNHISEYIFFVTQRAFDKYGIDWKKFSYSFKDMEKLCLQIKNDRMWK